MREVVVVSLVGEHLENDFGRVGGFEQELGEEAPGVEVEL